MPYFVILTYFALAVMAWGSVIALCASVPNWRAAVPYGWRMLVGSSVGFVLANLASVVIGVAPVLLALLIGIDRDDPRAQIVSAFALFGLFIGPLLASPIGFVGGAWLGFRRASRALHAAA
jgi:MFS family permease